MKLYASTSFLKWAAHHKIESDSVNSMLLNPNPVLLSCFSWEKLHSEVNNHCPMLNKVPCPQGYQKLILALYISALAAITIE